VRQPFPDRGQALGVHAVDPLGALGAHGHQSGLAQDLQVLRDGGLGDGAAVGAEPFAERLGHRPGRAFAVAEQLHDPAAHRVAERIEGGVGPHVSGVSSGGATV
jgi:hypothetical protein